MIVQFYEYTKSHWIVHVKRVDFMVYEFYLSKAVTLKNNITYFKWEQFEIWNDCFRNQKRFAKSVLKMQQK